jgi:subtilase family serine protease
MKHRRGLSIAASVALLAGAAVSVAVGSAGAAPTGRAAVAATQDPLVHTARRVGSVASSTIVSFDVSLAYRNAAGAAATVAAVSDPTSASYHHYLTAAAWEQRFSPTAASVATVTSWLRHDGLAVTSVTPDRLNVLASGPAARVEQTFGVSLGDYRVDGHTTRLASSNATVPVALAGIVAGVAGLSQIAATPDTATSDTTTTAATTPIPPAPGYRNPSTCSKYWAARRDTSDPAYGGGYRTDLPYALCGYVPKQLQRAYGLQREYDSGITGKGVTVAIVDAYAAPTLLSDSQRYYTQNDPEQPLASAQFGELLSPTFNSLNACDPSGWYGEQTLDVEAVHATAPGANILYVGAENCFNGLYAAVEGVVDNHLANVITDSWGDDAGDLLDASSDRMMFDNVLEMAAGTGIGVQFSAGDSGDEFATTGLASPDYPASSPLVTAVGGTSLAVGATGKKLFETGWSTSKSTLCTEPVVKAGACTKAQIGKYIPAAPGKYDYGGGGGTSWQYPEPSWQKGIVAKRVTTRNAPVTGRSGRVVPDISMDADPATGMLVGETQAFPNGTYYDQYKIGGTSLASPLFAGVMALADQKAGFSLGFVDPALYKSYGAGHSDIYDIVPRTPLAVARVDFINSINNKDGDITSVRTLGYEGPESFCDNDGNCATRPVILSTAKGYDSMTGLGSPGPGFVSALTRY